MTTEKYRKAREETTKKGSQTPQRGLATLFVLVCHKKFPAVNKNYKNLWIRNINLN